MVIFTYDNYPVTFGVNNSAKAKLTVNGNLAYQAATNGPALLDASTGHWWKVTVAQNGTGALVTTDVGATP
jgi:hypothetical protein